MNENNAAQAAEQAIKAAIRKAYDDGYNDAKMAPDNCSTYCVERSVRLDSAALLSALRAPVADEREPLPCPFCGGRAFATYKTDEDDIRWHSVHCRTECRGYGKHGSEKDAIAAWNTRTTLLRKYPNDEEIIDLAVEPLGIDCDRMPHGVVVFARNLLSRYAAPQASEAVDRSPNLQGIQVDRSAELQGCASEAVRNPTLIDLLMRAQAWMATTRGVNRPNNLIRLIDAALSAQPARKEQSDA